MNVHGKKNSYATSASHLRTLVSKQHRIVRKEKNPRGKNLLNLTTYLIVRIKSFPVNVHAINSYATSSSHQRIFLSKQHLSKEK